MTAREQFCIALAARAGQVVTRGMAVELVQQLFPERAFPPETFGQKIYGDYSFQCERFSEVLPELHVQHEMHYAETENYRMGLPMNPDYEGMQERERAGGLVQFTSRCIKTGALAGNMRVNIAESTHTQTLVCTEDTFFVAPQYRGGFMAVRLWQFVEDSVRAIGVREVRFTSKLANGADRMAKYLKYQAVGLMHVKIFDNI